VREPPQPKRRINRRKKAQKSQNAPGDEGTGIGKEIRHDSFLSFLRLFAAIRFPP
jgi:hypothetical protein